MPPTSSISSVLRWLLACLLLLITPFAQAALTINADGTVTDPNTGLTWMRCSMGQTWDGSTCTGTASTHTVDQANALADMVTFAGQSDWRLPNIRELQTIVDRSVYSPAIDGVAFPNTPISDFLSASPYTHNLDFVWLGNFSDGRTYGNLRSSSYTVRLVRGEQSFGPLLGVTRPTSDYVDNGNGTVTHKPTNLTWQRCAQGQTWTGSTCSDTASTYTLDQANALADTTIFAGQSDWRVPTEDELLSLLDYTIASPEPMISSSTFPATPGSLGSGFWSSSPSAEYLHAAWYVHFDGGFASYNSRFTSLAVRLVRGGQSFGSLVLMISKSGTGTGTVTSSPSGINCGNTCSEFFTSGTSVDLTATPATGSTFTGWSGACTGTQSCTVSMTTAQGVTATFAPSVTAPVCTLSANSSTIVVGSSSTLTASCSPVATSYTWTGDTCAGTTGSTCTVTPAATTTYAVAGTNADGTGAAVSATVTVTSSSSVLQPNADGTVFDPKTGLTWMRCTMGQTWDGSTCTGTASTSTFDQANTLTGMVIFSGQNDWRMPNIRELQTIVDRSVYSPAINSVAFPNTPSSDFWSDSLLADNSVSAWSVNFDYGYASAIGRSDGYYAVRLVRGGQSFGSLVSITRPTSDYVDNDNGTVTHTPTNLTWKRCTQGQTWTGSTCTGTASTYTFDQANGLTGATTFAGQSDWRVPTEDELLSLVDYTIANPGPMINSSIFPATPDTYYSYLWSSSPLANASDGAWYVYFGSGYPLSGYRGSNMGVVQLVRGGQSIGPFALTISKSGTGTGTITSSPAGISCDSTCSASFTSDTSVTLTATPATDSTFSGWSGACTGTGSCTVSMTAAKNVTATFTLSILAPVCTLSANPATITAGSSTTLTASCTPAATSYTWTGGTCAGTTGTTCTATPAATTTYTVAGTNTGGTGTAASATVTVNACTYALGASSASVSASASTGNVSVTATCAWTATSNASWLTITSGASGSGNGTVAYTVAANTGTSSRTGTLTVAGQTFTVTQGISPPACTLSANPSSITVGSSATLTASCSPAATSYTWTGGTCAGTTAATCTTAPTASTTYTVAGTNAGGTSAASSAVVTVTSSGALHLNADGTVFDPKTGLTWMRCSMGQTWTGSACSGAARTYTFDETNALTGTVEFANQSDWRMPTIRELQTIVDRSVYGPAIDRTAFPNTPSSNAWSGSASADGSTFAWLVYFNYGGAYYGNRGNSYTVRLVRGGQSSGPLLDITRPTSDYVDNGDGTVTHTPTTLTWKRCAQGQTWIVGVCAGTASTYTFDQANALTGTTTFAGQSDWRLPTEDELVSLVDYAISSPGPMINSSVFPATPGLNFWSASAYAYSASSAWFVHFLDGDTYNGSRSDSNAVRMVRGGLSADAFVLTVGKGGTGAGTITSAPAGIGCGSTCSATFARGTSVTLTATPAAGSTFTGWSGACTGTGACNMTAAGSVTATFALTTTASPVCTLSASPASITAGSSTTLTASCTPAATSYAWTGGTCAGATGASCTVTPTATTTYTVAGTNAGGTGAVASASVTVASVSGAPVCTLSANPASITTGGSSTLRATCNPAATSYIWTGGTCAGTSSSSCTVTPTATTTYSVQGINPSGAYQAISTTVTVTASATSYTVPGTLGNDVFVLTAANTYYGGGGNDTFIISPNTLRSNVTARIVDSEGDNLIQLVDGMTVTASSFYTDAAQLTLSSGAKVQILGASKFKFQVGANAPAGDAATILTYAQFVSSLGASLTSGTLPASGTAGYVVPTGFTQASAPAPAVAGSSYTVPGTPGDDVFVPSGGNSYLGGGGNDTYLISPYTLSGTVTTKIIDTEGANVIQLVHGLTIASSTFYNDAMQLTLSNSATVQILGASGFAYQLGANAPTGETANSLNYAQFAAMLGAVVPTGASAVGGSANFVVQGSGH